VLYEIGGLRCDALLRVPRLESSMLSTKSIFQAKRNQCYDVLGLSRQPQSYLIAVRVVDRSLVTKQVQLYLHCSSIGNTTHTAGQRMTNSRPLLQLAQAPDHYRLASNAL